MIISKTFPMSPSVRPSVFFVTLQKDGKLHFLAPIEALALSHLSIFCRMRAKTSDFLKVLNRAKISEESNKKKPSYMGKLPFV